MVVYGIVALAASVGFYYLLLKLEPSLSAESQNQATFLESLSPSYLPIAIISSAGLSLFLELAVIRWQGTILQFFAFYKNYGLLSCFAGLGLGYALSRHGNGIPLSLTLPLLAWQFGLLTLIRYGLPIQSLQMVPFKEQLTMGSSPAKPYQILAVYLLLAVVFFLTALAFVPVGQLCGKLMERKEQLSAYGQNLLGSLLGVLAIFLLSFFWTPPIIWFGLSSFVLLFFLVRTPRSLFIGFGFTTLIAAILAWPVNPISNRVYSPYQLLEIGNGETGLMTIWAAGTYYQRVYDFSSKAVQASNDPVKLAIRQYYELPYKVRGNPDQVAVVGAGSGNDVAAALRAGAKHVDAIEIDPAILLAGKINHPEKPYDDPRVDAVVNDARSFFRTTAKTYDTIIYGLLDSHTLLSQASSVRLDSFVYTVEGLREAKSRLKENGILSLSFVVLNDDLGTKIFRMMTEAFDGKEPICISTYGGTIFLESSNSSFVLPPAVLSQAGFKDLTAFYHNSALKVDVSTDDWPFFYMPRRIYPVSYLVMIVLVVLLSIVLFRGLLRDRLQFSELPFFFLGAGFMLVETKAITELGLAFGNTWLVIAIAISAILVMAFLANSVVAWLHLRNAYFAYLLVVLSLGFGWWVSRMGGLPPSTIGRIGTAIILTCPLFFSGIVFSVLLSAGPRISSAMSMNLLGAMCGGLLEYNSMYFGFRFLYLLAICLYVAALLSGLRFRTMEQLQPVSKQV